MGEDTRDPAAGATREPPKSLEELEADPAGWAAYWVEHIEPSSLARARWRRDVLKPLDLGVRDWGEFVSKHRPRPEDGGEASVVELDERRGGESPRTPRTWATLVESLDFTDTELESGLVSNPELRIPASWDLSNDGLSTFGVRGEPSKVCSVGCYINRAREDVSTGSAFFELVYWTGARTRWRKTWVAQAILLDADALKALAPILPIASRARSKLAEFFEEIIAANRAELFQGDVASRCGWHGRRFAPSKSLEVVASSGDVETRRDIEALKPRGELGQWVDVFRATAHGHPNAALAVYASCASVLVEPLRCELNPVVHFGSQTSHGKTTALYLAASVWGNPRQLVRSWNTTAVALENTSGFFHHLPTFRDELKQAPKHGLETMVYQQGNGTGRTRGAAGEASRRVTPTWANVMLSTGEMSLVGSLSGGVEGANARVLEIHRPPYEAGHRELVDRVKETTVEHYGHAGAAFVEAVAELDLAELRARLSSRATELKGELGGAAGRTATIVALIELAAEILHRALGVPMAYGVEELLGGAVSETETNSNLAPRLRDDLLSLVTQHEHRFARANESGDYRAVEGELYGWLDTSKGRVDVVPTVFRRWVEELGFTDEHARTMLARSGYLVTDTQGRKTVAGPSIDGRRSRVVRLRIAFEGDQQSDQRDQVELELG